MTISGAPISGATISGVVGAFVATAPLFVSSTTGMLVGDTIEIMLDNGEFLKATITQIPAFGQILISKPLPFHATAGNVVVDLTESKNVPPLNTHNL